MFSIAGNVLTKCCDPENKGRQAVMALAQLLDLAGAIALIALAALAITGQGGDLIATLNHVPRGPWVMMLAGFVTIGVAYLFQPVDHNAIRATVRSVLAHMGPRQQD